MNQTSLFSLSFCIHPRPLLWKIFKQFRYKYQYQSILIILVICLGMILLKYSSFNTYMGIRMMQSKKKPNRNT